MKKLLTLLLVGTGLFLNPFFAFSQIMIDVCPSDITVNVASPDCDENSSNVSSDTGYPFDAGGVVTGDDILSWESNTNDGELDNSACAGTDPDIEFIDAMTSDTPGECGSGGFFIFERTWTVTDCNGDTDECMQLIYIADDVDPIIVTCPTAPVQINLNPGDDCDQNNTNIDSDTGFPFDGGGAMGISQNDFEANVSMIDENCEVYDISYQDFPTGEDCSTGLAFVGFEFERRWVVTDKCGNTAECIQTVQLMDMIGPVIIGFETNPEDFFFEQDMSGNNWNLNVANCPVDLMWIEPTNGIMEDNCSNTVTLIQDMNNPGSGSFDSGTTGLRYFLEDECGNRTSAEWEINITCSAACTGGGMVFEDCTEPTPQCDFDEINGFESCTPEYGGSPQGPLCGGVINNPSYFTFIAGSETVGMTITPDACTTTPNGFSGVQASVIDVCGGGNCYGDVGSNCFTNTFSFTANGLSIGEQYQLIVDGCDGSECAYTVSVNGGQPFQFDDPIQPAIELQDWASCDTESNLFCTNTELTFFPQNQEDASFFFCWSIDNSTGVTNTNADNGCETADGSSFNCSSAFSTCGALTLNFSQPGDYQVCLEEMFNGCDTWDAGGFCYDITIRSGDPVDFGLFEICENELPWEVDQSAPSTGEDWTGSDITATGTYSAMVLDDCGCEYEQQIEVNVLEIEDLGNTQVQICLEDFENWDDPVTGVDYNDVRDFYTPGQAPFFVNFDSSMPWESPTQVNSFGEFCNQYLQYEFYVYDFDGVIVQSPGSACNAILEFNFTNLPSFIDQSDINYQWNDLNGFFASDQSSYSVTEAGNYELVLILDNGQLNCEFTFDADVVIDNSAPAAPTIIDPQPSTCASSLNAIDFFVPVAPGAEYSWTITNGTQAAISADGSTLGINIDAGATSAEVCVTSTSDCGPSPEACHTITVTPEPVVNFTAIPDSVCVGEALTIGTMLQAGTASDYNWMIPDATAMWDMVNSGNTASLAVTWSTPGMQSYSVQITDAGGCESAIIMGEVFVKPPLEAPIVDCQVSSSSITFTWTNTPGSSGTDFQVLSGQMGTQNGNSYTVTGLSPGDMVSYQISSTSSAVCGNSAPFNASCTASNCAYNVNLNAPQTMVCLDGMQQPIQITEVTNAMGTITWSNTPGFDAGTGLFDPTIAGAGTHIITYSVADPNDPTCNDVAEVTIEVFDIPNETFAFTSNEFCATDPVTLTYDNTAGFTYNFSDPSNPVIDQVSTPGTVIITYPVGTAAGTVTMMISGANCSSMPVTLPIAIVNPLEAPVINCAGSTSNSVTFNWNPVPGATDYTVNVTSGQTTGMMSGAEEYIVTGLTPGENVTIEVIANGGGVCGTVMSSFPCDASNCSLALDLLSPQNNICLDGTEAPFQLVEMNNSIGDYTWTGTGVNGDGMFTPSMDNIGNNVINLSVYDAALDCTAEASVTVTVLGPPSDDFSPSAAAVCIGEEFTISFPANANFTYDWTFGADADTPMGTTNTDFPISFSAAGMQTISMEVTDNGCASTVIQEIEVYEALNFTGVFCGTPSQTSVSFDWDDETGASGYIVDDGSGPQAMQQNSDYIIDGLDPGDTGMITVTAIHPNGCEDIVQISPICEAQNCPTYTVNIDDGGQTTYCFDPTAPIQLSAIVLDDNMNPAGGVGTWTGDGIDPMSGQFVPAEAGEFEITYNFAADGTNCPGMETITIVVNEIPSNEFVPADGPFCVGDDVIITIPGGFNTFTSYSWTPADLDITNNLDGTWTLSDLEEGITDVGVVVTLSENGLACDSEENVVPIEMLAPIPFNFSIDNETICYSVEDPIQMEALDDNGNPVMGSWSGDAAIDADGTFQPTEGNTTYTLIFTEANCQSEQSTDIEILLAPSLALSVLTDTICIGDMAMITIDTDNPNEITHDGDQPDLNGGLGTNEYAVSFPMPGLYEYVTFIDQIGDCDSPPIAWAVLVEPEVELPIISCAASTLSSVTFEWTDVPCAEEYIILIDDQPMGSQTGTSITIDNLDENQEVEINLSFTSSCKCTPEVITPVTCTAKVCAPIDIAFTNTNLEFCGSASNGDVAIDVTVSGDEVVGDGTYTWGGDANADGTISPDGLVPGDYMAIVNYAEAGCSETDSVTFTVYAAPNFDVTPNDASCFDDPNGTILIDDGGAGNLTATIDGTEVPIGTEQTFPTGSYTVLVSDDGGCSSTMSFNIAPAAEPSTSIDGPTFIWTDSLDMFSFNINVADTVTVVWTVDGVEIPCTSADCLTLDYTPTAEGEFVICATATYNDGCMTTLECRTVDTRFFSINSIFVPNVINPEGDPPNNEMLMFIEGFDVVINSVSVFDRWGNRVYNDPEQKSGGDEDILMLWDGRLADGDFVPGVYIYHIDIEINDEPDQIIDDITIMK